MAIGGEGESRNDVGMRLNALREFPGRELPNDNCAVRMRRRQEFAVRRKEGFPRAGFMLGEGVKFLISGAGPKNEFSRIGSVIELSPCTADNECTVRTEGGGDGGF